MAASGTVARAALAIALCVLLPGGAALTAAPETIHPVAGSAAPGSPAGVVRLVASSVPVPVRAGVAPVGPAGLFGPVVTCGQPGLFGFLFGTGPRYGCGHRGRWHGGWGSHAGWGPGGPWAHHGGGPRILPHHPLRGPGHGR